MARIWANYFTSFAVSGSCGAAFAYVMVGLGTSAKCRIVHLRAKHLRKKRIWGPLTESLLMAVMFVPVIVLAVLVAAELELDDRWFSVVTILVGILLGSVVSVPLRQFLLDLGNLPPHPRWEGTDDEL